MQFANKVVLVTGGSEGLGKGVAQAFVRAGAHVVVNGRNGDKLAQAVAELTPYAQGDARVVGISADVGKSAEVAKMFAQVCETFGTLDVLINNAAHTPTEGASVRARLDHLNMMTKPVPKHSLGVTREMSDEVWQAMIETNLNGVFYCTREALRLMEPKVYGKIVNVASVAGIAGISPHSPHYSASKGGVVAFTRSVAVEVVGAGINVNCIAAGGVATEAWDAMIARAGEAVRGQLMQLIPAGRMGTLNEFASLALYLASDEAAYLVGQVISPNGGLVT